MNNEVRKKIVVTKCLSCPLWGKCYACKKLTKRERFIITFGNGVGDFILKDCHLENE